MKVEAKNKRNKIIINEKFDHLIKPNDIKTLDFEQFRSSIEAPNYCIFYEFIPLILKFIKKQSNELCLEIVKRYGHALKYVKNQTKLICLAAVKETGWAICYVSEPTPEICLAAVEQEPISLAFIEMQTEEICLAAVKKDGLALKYVKNKKEESVNFHDDSGRLE